MTYTPGLARVLGEVADERDRQDAKWGGPEHDDRHRDGTGSGVMATAGTTWHHILSAHAAAAFAESDPARLRVELVQVAAVVVAWVQAIDRRPVGGGHVRLLPTARQEQ